MSDKLVDVCPRCANTYFCPRECTPEFSPVPKVVMYTQSELDQKIAEAVLAEFLYVQARRPLDPIYWDMHHESDLRARIEANRAKAEGKGETK